MFYKGLMFDKVLMYDNGLMFDKGLITYLTSAYPTRYGPSQIPGARYRVGLSDVFIPKLFIFYDH